MPMALQTQRYEGVKISKAYNTHVSMKAKISRLITRCMVSNATTSRETPSDYTTRIHISTLKKLGYEGGKFREWMTVARDDRSAWALQ
jgi:hypothetical protein